MDKNGLSDPYVKLFLQPRNKLVSRGKTLINEGMNCIIFHAAKVSYKNTLQDSKSKLPGNIHFHRYVQGVSGEEETMVSV